MTDIVFSAESIASLVIMAALGIGIPVAAALVWRFALHKGTMKATFIGAGMFFLFAIILERLLHMVMVPVVSGNVVLYVVYGAVAAGVFEETARFLSFRFLMKNSRSAENAVSYGLGHGGFEALYILGLTALSALMMAASVNSMGVSEFINSASGGSDAVAQQLMAQLAGFAQSSYSGAALAVFERIAAMTLHVSLSVLVMEAGMVKGRMWLYPAAIVIHALMDVPAVLYQCGAINIVVCEVIMAVFTAVWAVVAVKRYKYLRTK